MAINSFDFQAKLTGELDKALEQKSVTSFMEDNSFGAQFVGSNSVVIPDVSFSGLGNYDRNTGFPEGSILVNNTTYRLSMERARSFQLDRMDADETSIAGLAGKVMSEFVRTKVAPEIDAYVFSKLADIISDRGQYIMETGEGTLEENSVAFLNEAIDRVHNNAGYDEELVAFVNPTFYTALMNSPMLDRHIEISNFQKGEVNTQVKKFNGVTLIPVPASRIRTNIKFYDGISSSETMGGFLSGLGSKAIYFLVMPKSAVKLVKKTEKIRIFSPDQNPEMDAYKLDYRIYYDAFVKNSAVETIFGYIES